MFKPVNKNNIFIIGIFFINASFADDELNNSINEEYENMSNRTSLDYHSKVVQVWHDSVWINKAKAIKTYDENGYLYQKDLYKYRNDDWELKGMASFENNENGDPLIRTKQVYRNGTWINRHRTDFNYNDDGLLLLKLGLKWRHDEWKNKVATTLTYEGDLCVTKTISKWRDSTWVDRVIQDLSYNLNGDRDEKVTYRWRDSTWTPKHKMVYGYNSNFDLSEKLFYKWVDSTWVNKARASITFDDNLNPLQILLEKKDSTNTWVNVSLRENTFSEDNMLLESAKYKWYDEDWMPRKRHEYIYTGERGTISPGFFEVLPKKVDLIKTSPNPFNPVTNISYRLLETGHISIDIYDMLGNKVRTLVSQTQNAGTKSYQWNATNDLGQTVSAGMYIYTIQTGDFIQTKKMILLK